MMNLSNVVRGKWLRLLTVLFSSTMLLSGCGGQDDQQRAKGAGFAQYPYDVVSTTGMVSDAVRQVVDEKANVKGLMGAGVDPHMYTPTRSDVAALSNADAIFYNGLMLEGKMTGILNRMEGTRPVFAVAEQLDHTLLLQPEGATGHFDPHIWMDPTLWRKAVGKIGQSLAESDPPNAEYYQKNAEEYQEKLDQLIKYTRKVIETIPQEQRVLVTAHDAFNYFGRAYDITVKGIQGLSTESEAGLDDINTLIDYIIERNVQAVFVETSVADKNVRALLEGARSRGHELKVGGKLYSDAMGPTGTYEGTYIGMLDHNVTTIVRALGGEAPKKGMQGKLDLK
jgi:manganese/zinc/iron transport system substrate-binding protein